MIVVVADDPDEGFVLYGPYADEQEIEQSLRDKYCDSFFWIMPQKLPPGAPELAAARWREMEGDRFAVLDTLRWQSIGPFTDKAAAARLAAHFAKARDLLKPE